MNRTKPTMHGGVRPMRAGPVIWIAFVAMTAFVLPSAAVALDLPDRVADATYAGDESCVDCHSELAETHAAGFHGGIRDFQAPNMQRGCEACHGPGSKHVESNEVEDILNPAKTEATLAGQICLQCHRNDHLDGYEFSMHALSDVSCVSCHDVHGEQRAGLLQASEPGLCNECHSDVRNQTYLPSHHPIKEGKMVCTDCHDTHRGGFATKLAGETVNDLCFNCHSNKQGPFIFEHDPVIEDCTICHNAHGAVANNLLRQNEPFLCLQCHQAHFHATLQGIEGEYTTLDGYSGMSTRDGGKKTMLTKCTQCHSEVHGSDLPSQSISGGGGALTR